MFSVFRSLPPVGTPIMLDELMALVSPAQGGRGQVSSFAEDIRRHFAVRHSFMLSSGRAAITTLLCALKRLRPSCDEVLIPAYTSFSVPSAVVKAGLKVSLYDVDSETLGPDAASLEEAINERTLCVIACHLYGYPCDMDAVVRIGRRRGVFVIDDAAQSMGARYGGRLAGTFGDAGIFSLSRGKNITTVDGGIIVINSDAIAAEVENTVHGSGARAMGRLALAAKSFAMSAMLNPRLYWIPRGIPFLRLGASVFSTDFQVGGVGAMQARLGIKMLKRLNRINAARSKTAMKLIERLKGVEDFYLPRVVEGAEPVFLKLPVIFRGTARVEPRYGIVRSYPCQLGDLEPLAPHLAGKRRHPQAERLAKGIVTVPTHEYVNDGDIGRIAAFLAGARKGGGRWR